MSREFAIALFACLSVAVVGAMADEGKGRGKSSSLSEGRRVVTDFDLKSYRQTHRPLLIFAPSPTDPRFREQESRIAKDSRGLADRDMRVVQVFEEAGFSRVDGTPLANERASELRKQFRVEAGAFVAVLVGKDGAEKLRSGEPVSMGALFGLIDSMPMRRREMQERKR